jgi:hypothetical protein
MPQLAPVDEITTVENRQTWKIFKRGSHQVIVLAHPTNGWVRIKAWQNRVMKCAGHGLLLSVEHIGDTVADVVCRRQVISDIEDAHHQFSPGFLNKLTSACVWMDQRSKLAYRRSRTLSWSTRHWRWKFAVTAEYQSEALGRITGTEPRSGKQQMILITISLAIRQF